MTSSVADVLGLDPQDLKNLHIVKAAYRRLLLLCHPDKSNAANEESLPTPLKAAPPVTRLELLVKAYEDAIQTTPTSTELDPWINSAVLVAGTDDCPLIDQNVVGIVCRCGQDQFVERDSVSLSSHNALPFTSTIKQSRK